MFVYIERGQEQMLGIFFYYCFILFEFEVSRQYFLYLLQVLFFNEFFLICYYRKIKRCDVNFYGKFNWFRLIMKNNYDRIKQLLFNIFENYYIKMLINIIVQFSLIDFFIIIKIYFDLFIGLRKMRDILYEFDLDSSLEVISVGDIFKIYFFYEKKRVKIDYDFFKFLDYGVICFMI